MTRDRLRFADEKFPVTTSSKPGEYGPPPSFSVTDKTKLKPGRILLVKDNNDVTDKSRRRVGQARFERRPTM